MIGKSGLGPVDHHPEGTKPLIAGNIAVNRLLLIDDDVAIGRFIKRVAEGLEFEAVTTTDPAVFLKRARTWRPTVIILDLQMPGADGIELLRDLAADNCTANVILASGVDRKVLESAKELGEARGLRIVGILQKPISLATLRESLAAFRPVSLLSSELADAIDADHLFLEYQPKVDLRLGRIVGVEALARWKHPLHGIIQPDEFIALAEQSDLIHRLTDWAVVTAAKQTVIWQRDNLALDVAVNVSARDIEDRELPERLDRHCRDAGSSPGSMTLELTETSAMREAVQMMDVLTRLRLKGFRLSIDDFGTGYSSLVQLQRLPFSEVKIDRSFVIQMTKNKGCRVIAEIVVDLARKLELKSVAEGVEDEAALNLLAGMGCDMAQGYFLSRPVAADRIPKLALGTEVYIHEENFNTK